MVDLLLLATEEGVPGTHIAATIVPIVGAIFFCGSVYLLLWSNYGAKKGALIYGTAFFGFAFVLGVFWWFGAPGTPVAVGLQNFPGQPPNQYVGKWFAMEPGSERAGFFEVTEGGSLESFQTPAEFLGLEDASQEEIEADPRYATLSGDLAAAAERMRTLYLPLNDAGAPILGQERRAAIQENLPPDSEIQGRRPATPFYTARIAPREDGEAGTALLTEDRGVRVAGAPMQVVATYVNADPDAAPDPQEFVVEEEPFYAFKDPGAIWFPSAVWTVVAAVLAGACLFGLDRIEMREKARVREREPVAA